MAGHAFNSPSAMDASSLCNLKPWREMEFPGSTNDSADEGTAAHFLQEQCLEHKVDAAHFHGTRIKVENGHAEFHQGGKWPVGPDFTREVQKSLDVIHSLADGATIYPEQKLPISFITNEYRVKATGAIAFRHDTGAYVDILTGQVYAESEVEEVTGTSDVVIVKGKKAIIADLKFGRGVQVDAVELKQLLMYGAAAVRGFDMMGEIEEIELHILQPRLNNFDVWRMSVAEMDERIEEIRQTSNRILAGPKGLCAVPGEKQCRFCKASATCKERTEHTMELIVGEFVDLDKGFVKVEMPQAEKLLAQSFGVKPSAITFEPAGHGSSPLTPDDGDCFVVKKPSIRPSLEAATEAVATADDERLATLMDAADMIEGFAKAVRAEVERRLLAGSFTDARYKLVEGRQGARSWIDEEQAEAALKAMRLKSDEMYDRKVISPTSAEKLLGESNKRKWAKLQPLITRSDGKPSVAPASDKCPALSMAIADGFEVLSDDPNAEWEKTFGPDYEEHSDAGISDSVSDLAASHADGMDTAKDRPLVEDSFDDLV